MSLGRMNALINAMADAPFVYGKNDCFHFTNNLVKEFHGLDFAPVHRYKGKKGALRYLRLRGDIEDLTTETLGNPIPPIECRNGDVVTAEVAANEVAIGFVWSGGGYFKSDHGVGRLSLSQCRKGWRIRACRKQ